MHVSFLWKLSFNMIINFTFKCDTEFFNAFSAQKHTNFSPKRVEEPSNMSVNSKSNQVFTACPMEEMVLGHFSPWWVKRTG